MKTEHERIGYCS